MASKLGNRPRACARSDLHFRALVLLALLPWASLRGQSVRWAGMASGWAAYLPERPKTSYAGVRYLPELSSALELGPGWSLDGELSVNAYVSGWCEGWHSVQARAKLYRSWVRLSRPQWEVRAGLQKLNFGSATLLRPLMWFDRLDPRDPLQLADGVTGILGRYYLLANATVWAWVLFANEDPKGWEVFPTSSRHPEFGGRVQVPVPAGEVAVSFHQRVADVSAAFHGEGAARGGTTSAERRLALDGKWDLSIGLWLEGTISKFEVLLPAMRYQKMATLGVDYTLGLGNGLHVLGETLWMSNGEFLWEAGERFTFSASMASYPVNIVDMVSAVVFYDWHNGAWYRFASWRRSLDNWQFYLMPFWNPKFPQIYRATSGAPQFAGKGVQVMAVFNH
ncbi:MAG: hypothetical protein H5U38_11035 [Calditrichaeota bacterium]|nr:hypothetical protein [Calditrichota bacterium]